jgi:uncharacterized membrane protein
MRWPFLFPASLILSPSDTTKGDSMNLVPDWAPNVHPMFVHFPVGLLFTAVAVDLLSLLFGSREWLRRGAVVLYVAGALVAVPTYFSGRFAADDVIVPAAAESILTEHETYALWTLLFFGVFAVVRLAVELVTRGGRRWLRIALFVGALPGAFLLWETAEHGSEMVYAHGVGIRNSEDVADRRQVMAGESGLELNESGGWSWHPGPEVAGALGDSLFWWVEGDPSDFWLDAVNDSAAGVVVYPRRVPLTFAVRRDLSDVQVAAEIDPRGSGVMLVYHVQPSGDFDFLHLQDQQLRLGRVQNGSTSVFHSSPVEARGFIRLRAASDGTHFRGYVNDRLLVHAHGDPLPPGGAGFRIVAADTLLLNHISAEPL